VANDYVDRKRMREQARAAGARSGSPGESARCSFCGADETHVETMFSGESANICGDCAAKIASARGCRGE